MTELVASHDGIKGPGVSGETASGRAAGTAPRLPRQPASRRSRARPAALRPAPRPRGYLRTPLACASPPRPPLSVGPPQTGAAGFAPRGSAGTPSGSGQPGCSQAGAPRSRLSPPRRAHAFCCQQFSRQRRSTPPAPLRDPAPRWLRPKVSRPT